MPLDAIVLRHAANELNAKLCGASIDKIYQPQSYEIILSTRRGALLISVGGFAPRICLTQVKRDNPTVPPMFTMLLRKHLAGASIIAIEQEGFERIVRIRMSTRNELGDRVEKSLVCEIMGRNSNIILTDEEDKIIDAVRRASIEVNGARAVLPHFKYTTPPRGGRTDPSEGSVAIFDAISSAAPGMRADEALTSTLFGVSPLIAREAVYRVTGDTSLRIEEANAAQKAAIAAALAAIFREEPCCIILKNEKRDFTTVRITQYGDCAVERFDSVSEMLESFYAAHESAEQLKARAASVSKIVHNNLSRVRKKKIILSQTLRDAENGGKYREWADIITANIYKIKPRDTELTAEDFYNGGFVTIGLDASKTAAQNAQNYYKKYNKSKSAQKNASQQLEGAAEEEKYLESVEEAICSVETVSDIEEIRRELVREGYLREERTARKKKKEETQPPLRFEYEGYEIFVGRNNTQNDYITLRLSRANDLWLHTKNIPGSHVLIKYRGEPFPDNVVEYAASIAAAHSKAKHSDRIAVDYCPIKNVRKPNGAKSGMVVYDGYSTAYVAPLTK
ncbi:MAG: NFACT RNA binding domain-containing protein [Clostridia bacterium]|nr:NFACT RNA binding domain-containing protein [Clostridia bacterium]